MCRFVSDSVFYSSASVVSLDFHEIPFITHGAEEVFCKRQVVDSLEWDIVREGECFEGS